MKQLPINLQKHPLILQLMREIRHVNLQDVNDSVIKNIPSSLEFLTELGIKESLNHISLMHLIESIECHNDYSFIGVDKRSKVLCIVLDCKFKKKYADSPYYPQFYTKRDGFMSISKWDMFWFDARQDHALLNNSRLKLATFWFNK